MNSFQEGLRDLGYVEGKSIVLEVRFTDRSLETAPELAAELLRLNVDVIVASGTPAALAVRNLTRTVPIVVVGVNDPAGTGLVRELSRPNQTPDLAMKRVQLLPGRLNGPLALRPERENNRQRCREICGPSQREEPP